MPCDNVETQNFASLRFCMNKKIVLLRRFKDGSVWFVLACSTELLPLPGPLKETVLKSLITVH